jgi:hypothetical protein
MHYLLQFCNFIDTIATLITDLSVFEPLSFGDKSVGGALAVRIISCFYQGWKLTTQNFIYLDVGPPEKIHHYVGFKGFQ